jgi:putative transcriptional regulator
MTKAGKRLLEAAREMNAIAKGEAEPLRMHIPAELDVKVIRRKLNLSQDAFASEFGFTINQIRDWEQNRTRPLQSDRAYLMLIDRHPGEMRRMLSEMRQSVPDETMCVAV